MRLAACFAIRSRTHIRDAGECAQQVERVEIQPDVSARDRTVDQPRHGLLHLCRGRRIQIGRAADRSN